MAQVKQVGRAALFSVGCLGLLLVASACGAPAPAPKPAAPVQGGANATGEAKEDVSCPPAGASTTNGAGTSAKTGAAGAVAANAGGTGAAAAAAAKTALALAGYDLAEAVVTYNGNIQPLITSSCVSCHAAGKTEPNLSTPAAVAAAKEGVVASVVHSVMPPGKALSAANIAIFQSWEKDGYLMDAAAAGAAATPAVGASAAAATPAVGASAAAAAPVAKVASGTGAAKTAVSASGKGACPAPVKAVEPAVAAPVVVAAAPVVPAVPDFSAVPATAVPTGAGAGGFDISSLLGGLGGGAGGLGGGAGGLGGLGGGAGGLLGGLGGGDILKTIIGLLNQQTPATAPATP